MVSPALLADLRRACGEDGVVTGEAQRRTYESDGLLQYAVTPGVVVLPASADEVRDVVRACHAAGFEPNVAFESDDYAVVQGLVAAGVGVALIPTLALSDRRDDIAVRELAGGGPSRQVIVATLSGTAPAPAVSHMVEILQHVAERYA